jgi:Glycosyl hydrolases family 2, TIM barrel domain/Glycosyl hydrolases family 2, sugar binding domain/Glycosyl hydrolases family 2
MSPQSAATSAHSKFIELAKKPHIFSIFFAFLTLSAVMVLSTIVCGMPLVLPNGQPTLEGLDAGIHVDSPTRKKIDLAGKWQFSINDEAWNEIKVPSSIDYEGRMTFHRTFTLDDELLNNFIFKFVALGINYECEVYINEVYVGKHVGGYTSFEFEIPEDALQIGKENTVKVIVSNRLNAYSTLPVRKQVWGWKNYGGILRDIYLLATPRLWVDRLSVQTRLNQQMEQATVHLDGVLNNRRFDGLNRDSLSTKPKQASYFLNAELYERFSDILVAQGVSTPFLLQSNKNINVQLEFVVNGPKLWSPESPGLYILKTNIISADGKQKTIVDQYNLNIGFASMRVENSLLVLNGNTTILKGVVWHEDSPKYGASLSYEQMEKDVVLIKSLGANAVRFAFHPPHPYMLDLCSRYGLAVLEEIPVWNVPADILNGEAFQSLAETQMREMIERDSHFPCVFAWSIGDQFDSADEEAAGFVQKVSGVARALDGRPVYYGTRMLKNDVCASYVDFVGIVLPSSDLKENRRLLSEWKKKHPEQPMIILSYGKEVDQENRNGYSDPSSQESQARFYLQYYAAIKEATGSGSFAAALMDWRGDRPLLSFPFGDHYLYPVGLLNQTREKRLAYEVVRALYNEERIAAIPTGSYRISFPWAHVLMGLFVILLIGYESTNRRFGESLKRSLTRSYNFFVDLRDLHAVSIAHTLILSSAISITFACLLSGIMYHYRGDKFADYVLTYLFVWDPLKVQFIHATWHPFAGIVVLTGLFFVFGMLLAFLIKAFALLVRARVSWFHVYSISVWSAAPVIFLSPLAMSLFKIMENPSYVIPSLVLMLLFFFWTFLRMLKGISVIYDLVLVKTYIGGIFVCILFLGGLFFYYDSVYALSSYVKFILHLAQNLG